MNKLILFLLSAVIFGCSSPAYKNPHVLIVTSLGDIELELFPEKAPKTVAAFLSYIRFGILYQQLILQGDTG